MPEPAPPENVRRRVPRTDHVLADPRLAPALITHSRSVVLAAVHGAQDRARGGEVPVDLDAVVGAALALLPRPSTRRVVNATGVVIHTNLGRAALSDSAIQAMVDSAGHTDVEFDLASGARGRRVAGVLAALRARVPAAGGALVVNNGAAALVLATTTLAAGREVVVSRGEMVEIGDGFRLHELIASTGARIREVGTTNRTRLSDYADAVGPGTGCVLKVHPSNFTVEGFTQDVGVEQLATLGVSVVHDIGSGLLHPHPMLPNEPDATTSLTRGAGVVTASGDKLLGGPQAGLVLGDADLVERMRRHPLARALRPDKTTLAALEVTLTGATTPTQRALEADPGVLRARAATVAEAVGAAVEPSSGRVGGGSSPGTVLEGWAVVLPEWCARPLRTGDLAVVGRVEGGRCLLDLRCVPTELDDAVVAAVRVVLASGPA